MIHPEFENELLNEKINEEINLLTKEENYYEKIFSGLFDCDIDNVADCALCFCRTGGY